MNKTDRDNWRKFLGIKDPQTALDAARIGVDIGKTAGRAGGSVGGGSFDGDNPPEGEEEEGAEKGDGAADFGEKLKVGDEFDRAEDLYDCETGEEVTLDGFGEKGTEAYPSGFQDCEKPSPPPDYVKGRYYLASYIKGYYQSESESGELYYHSRSLAIAGMGEIAGKFSSCAVARLESASSASCGMQNPSVGEYSSFYAAISSQSCASNYNPICDTEPTVNWPAVDKNHLTWNKEKGCFEPLCHELNNQVLDKYKGCEDERILCDADGNKVKVKVDGDVVKVTQEKYGQTAEIKNGKVTAVKKLTESQLEAEFK